MKTDNKGMTIMEVLISVCIIAIVLILLFSLLLQVRSEDTDNNIQSTFILTQASIIKNIEEDIVDYGLRSIDQCNPLNVLSDSDRSNIIDRNKIYCVQLNYGDLNNKGDSLFENDLTGIVMIYEYSLKYEVKADGSIKHSDLRGIVNGIKYSAWMIRYMRGNYVNQRIYDPDYEGPDKVLNSNAKRELFRAKTTVMKELPDVILMEQTMPDGSTVYYEPTVKYSANFGGQFNSGLLSIPVVTAAGEHYDIDISFEYKLPDLSEASLSACNKYKFFQCRERNEGFCQLYDYKAQNAFMKSSSPTDIAADASC